MSDEQGRLPEPPTEITDALVGAMRSGDAEALAAVFSHYRERLRRIVRFRLDYRMASRVSESDVLQETFLAAIKRLEHFASRPELPPFLWLRLLIAQQLVDLQRQHLHAGIRDARKEVSLQQQMSAAHTSLAIAARLVANATGASELVRRAEQIERLETKLNELDATDREVIALRHFEELSNQETASVLGIQPAAASKRYVRAMARLSEMMLELRSAGSQ